MKFVKNTKEYHSSLQTCHLKKCTENTSKERFGQQKQFSLKLSQVTCYIKLQLSIKQAAAISKDIHSLLRITKKNKTAN